MAGGVGGSSANRRDLCLVFVSRGAERTETAVCNRQNIRNALRTYTTLTNNSHILLNVDGQTFTVIVRLLKPAERSRTTSHMKLVIANTIYVVLLRFSEN